MLADLRGVTPGSCEITPEAEALEAARSQRTQGEVWTNGSCFDDGWVGAACAWQTEDGWTGRRFHLGNDKEVFDAETFAIYQALRILEARSQSRRKYTVFSDSQAAIRRVLTDLTEEAPDQVRWQTSLPHLARRSTERRTQATSQWIRDHVRPERRSSLVPRLRGWG